MFSRFNPPMKPFRTVLFWAHLAAGATAGVVILIMSVTGVALTYEKQMLEWADRRAWTAPPSTELLPLSPETLLARVAAAQPGTAPIGVTLKADRSAPATVLLDGISPREGAQVGRAVPASAVPKGPSPQPVATVDAPQKAAQVRRPVKAKKSPP